MKGGRCMDSDRVAGKVKETEGEIQQKWGEAKDKARDTWEKAKDKVESRDGVDQRGRAERADDEFAA